MGHRQRFQYRSPRFAQPGWWRRYGVSMAQLSYSYRTVSRGYFIKVYETKGLSDGGGGGSGTRVGKCHWSRAYMRSPVHALGITPGRSRLPLRTDKKRLPLA